MNNKNAKAFEPVHRDCNSSNEGANDKNNKSWRHKHKPREKEEDVDRESVEGLDTKATTVAQSRAGNIQANSHYELNCQVTEMIEKNEGAWKCKVCGKTTAAKGNIRKHAEMHTEGMSHVCHLCNKTFPTRKYLQNHISNIHSELFSCDICGKAGMNRERYRRHKNKHHRLGL